MSGNVSDPRFFDYDPFSGITEYFHYDPDTDGFTIQTQQDLEPLIEQNKALYNDTEKSTRYGDGIGGRVASFPAVITMQLAQQGILSMGGAILDEPRYRRWLNDSDNQVFRVRRGTV